MSESANILRQSKRRIQKLKLLSKFFDNVDLINICIKTEIIQSFFDTANNDGYDINKLELFHLQYTDSLISLLEKIKKQKEASMLILYREIDANNDYIEREIEKEKQSDSFEVMKRYQSGEMSQFLKNVYTNLVGDKKNLDFNKILRLSQKYADDYYRKDVKISFLKSLNSTTFYEYDTVKIERKLLGKLNKVHFRIRFICGYKVDSHTFELYKIVNSKEEFIWDLQKTEFYFLAEDIAVLFDRSPNSSLDNPIVSQLKERNKELEEKIKEIKEDIPDDINLLIEKYKDTIEDQNVLNQVLNIDEEMNILKTMLDFNINDKIQ